MRALPQHPEEPFTRYNSIAAVLHWTMAALILINVALAWNFRPMSAETRHVFLPLHESIGLTVLMLAIARLVWRWLHPPPAFDPRIPRLEAACAHCVHWLFYGFMILMPLTGWIVGSIWSQPGPLRWWGFHFPYFPWLPASAAGIGAMKNSAATAHRWLSYGFYVLFLVHVAGALKHQLLDRHNEFARVLPVVRRRPA